MTLPIFNPSLAPDFASGVDVRVKPRVLKAEFGDGYEQIAGDGLNNMPMEGTLTWSSLTTSQADAIVAFFVARQGFEAFEYTLPWESSARKWRCGEWQRSPAEYDTYRVQATIKETFVL